MVWATFWAIFHNLIWSHCGLADFADNLALALLRFEARFILTIKTSFANSSLQCPSSPGFLKQ
jgi:hypothetical protein